MGLMDSVIANDAAGFFDPDGFPGVETLVITFRNGNTRTVAAVVDRDPPVEFGAGRRPSMFVTFRNHATLGLLPTEIDGGGGITVTVAYPFGETAKKHQLRRVVKDMPADAGVVVVEVG